MCFCTMGEILPFRDQFGEEEKKGSVFQVKSGLS